MADYEIERERIVERPVERIVERPAGRRVVVERGGGAGYGFNPMAGVIMAIVAVLLVLLILGVLV
jgi:hypothetical protein